MTWNPELWTLGIGVHRQRQAAQRRRMPCRLARSSVGCPDVLSELSLSQLIFFRRKTWASSK